MYHKDKTASFDVDAQNGFTPNCPDELPVPGGNEIVAALNAQATLASFRVGSKDAHNPGAKWVATEDNPQFSPVTDQPELDIHWKRHCEVGTYGFELLAGLPHPKDYNFFVWKGVETDLHPYGACYHTLDWKTNRVTTGVIEVLRANGIENVIVGGLATDYCVKNTVLQLLDARFNVIVNLAACRGIAMDTIADAVLEMVRAGAVIVDDVMACPQHFTDKPTPTEPRLDPEFTRVLAEGLAGKTPRRPLPSGNLINPATDLPKE